MRLDSHWTTLPCRWRCLRLTWRRFCQQLACSAGRLLSPPLTTTVPRRSSWLVFMMLACKLRWAYDLHMTHARACCTCLHITACHSGLSWLIPLHCYTTSDGCFGSYHYTAILHQMAGSCIVATYWERNMSCTMQVCHPLQQHAVRIRSTRAAESGASARRGSQASTPTSTNHARDPPTQQPQHGPADAHLRGHCRDQPWQGLNGTGQCSRATGSQGVLEWGLSGVWGWPGGCQYRL